MQEKSSFAELIKVFTRKRAFLLQCSIFNLILFWIPTLAISCTTDGQTHEVLRLRLMQLVFGINDQGVLIKPQIFAILVLGVILLGIICYFIKRYSNNRKFLFGLSLVGFVGLILLQLHVYFQVIFNESKTITDISWKWPYWLTLAIFGVQVFVNRQAMKENKNNDLTSKYQNENLL